jgi:hypothetical protein
VWRWICLRVRRTHLCAPSVVAPPSRANLASIALLLCPGARSSASATATAVVRLVVVITHLANMAARCVVGSTSHVRLLAVLRRTTSTTAATEAVAPRVVSSAVVRLTVVLSRVMA